MNNQQISEEEEGFVPDEFSEENDMEEFMENEEQFEVRPSISSRGSIARATKDQRNDVQRQNNYIFVQI